MAKTFLQLVNRLRQEAGITGSSLTTLQSGLTKEGQRCKDWINEAWLDVQSAKQDWQWMRKTAAFPTVAGQAIYVPGSGIPISDLNEWDRSTFRNYPNPAVTLSIGSPCVATLQGHGLVVGDAVTFFTSSSLPTGVTAGTTYYVVSVIDADNLTFSATQGGAPINTSGSQVGTHTVTSGNTTTFIGLKSEVFMDNRDYESWRNLYQYGANHFTRSRPISMCVTPNKSIGLGPIPDSGYTVYGDYYSLPSEMSADGDIPNIPVQYEMVIVFGALIKYAIFEAANEVLLRGQQGYSSYMRRLANTRMKDNGFGGALA